MALQQKVEIDEIGLYHRVLNHKDVEKLSKVDTLSPLFTKAIEYPRQCPANPPP